MLRIDHRRVAGGAKAATASLIAQLLDQSVREVRTATEFYLEVVITGDQLDNFAAILEGHLGPAAKPFQQNVDWEAPLRALLDAHGGVRKDQCLYLQKYEDDAVAFAALWPWSGGDPITVKVGVLGPEDREP